MSAKKPLFAFFGTPRHAVFVLDALERHSMLPALVVTAPDAPAGRGLELTPPPAKTWAQERGIDVLQPTTLKDGALEAELANTEWDCFIVAAYNKIIPQAVLDLPSHGCLNVHPSLLPQFRGPSPIISAILADERHTGVSIMLMDAEVDHGPVLAQADIEIAEEEWPPVAPVLEEMLFTEGGNLLADTLPLWLEGKVEPIPQNNSTATFTKKYSADDARLDLQGDQREQFLKIRAFTAGPRAHFFVEKNGTPMRVIVTEAAWHDNTLEILRVIPEGKKEIPYSDFLRSLGK